MFALRNSLYTLYNMTKRQINNTNLKHNSKDESLVKKGNVLDRSFRNAFAALVASPSFLI